eukprot:CAMPEP_0197286420 /NCGR_PEP_ID=MMETSP0890-20130614/1835_1 /TAXON_ID=44058 ORGANISM="Aureoumbra lagunensis, Strain CCMP1510" /NCGR_SAMPLE_ID=MMETSP0890 /ASSEMBLY_ACC=CAM_ASM_000533 /LENGTH=355 /DNA_ID=CAMNT_0042754719 /DNA_START=131 /DNA_END=1198 /DNA_ORIENTATION=-
MDHYGGIASSKSDPYCVVMVDGKEVGRSSTITGTCDPVWPNPEWIKVETWGRVTIRIWDWDITSDDDAMGEVSFVVRDVEMAHRLVNFCPSEWLKVLPSDDSSPASGKLQIMYLFEDELGPKPSKWVEPQSLPRCLRNKTTEINQARVPVFLNYYDLGHSSFFSNFNKISPYGAFHSAIEIYGAEYSFGGTKRDVTGIFVCKPRRCALHTYRSSVYLGDCGLKRKQVETILRKLKPLWRGPDYELLRKNCCFFCREFTIELGLGEIPQWIYKLANLGSTLRDALHGPDLMESDVLGGDEAGGAKIDINAVLLEHIMAHRMQQAFRARRARRAAGIPSPRDTRSKFFTDSALSHYI